MSADTVAMEQPPEVRAIEAREARAFRDGPLGPFHYARQIAALVLGGGAPLGFRELCFGDAARVDAGAGGLLREELLESRAGARQRSFAA